MHTVKAHLITLLETEINAQQSGTWLEEQDVITLNDYWVLT